MSPPQTRRTRPVCTRPRPLDSYRRHDDKGQRTPQTFGLTDAELWNEATRLFLAGWSVAEIRATLDLPVRPS